MSSPFVIKPCDKRYEQAIKSLETSSCKNSSNAKNLATDDALLSGLGLAVKDLFHVKGLPTAAGNPDWEATHLVPETTNCCVANMLSAGATFKGKTITDELAYSLHGQNKHYASLVNPTAPAHIPGGSSSGSAVAVSAHLADIGLGTDTGGSIRQPASFCGVVGFKPSYGRISRHGLIAFASSFDQIGPFTQSVEDTALLYDIMAGEDEFDSTLSSKEVEKTDFNKPEPKALRIAYYNECLDNENLDPEIRQKTLDLIDQLKAEGHTVEPVEFSWLDTMVPIYYVITTAEASSNLARYDGVHYGYRSPNATDLESTYKLSRTEGFGTEVKRRILLGTFVLSSGYYDAYYGKAQKARRLVKEETQKIFENFDFIISPTTPGTAFPLGQEYKDPTVLYLEDIFTVQANISGIPAISLPLGKHSNGLPFGMQLMAPAFGEKELLEFSQYLMNKG